jgi:release factor glutamine methyltransferase
MDSTLQTRQEPAGDVRRTKFGSLSIEYDGRILEPRPWTVKQSSWAADLLTWAPPGPVLELCTGAGQIGLFAVTTVPRQLVCVDVDPAACDYARRNAARAGLADRVEVREGDAALALRPEERFAMIIADPPYVPSDEIRMHPHDPPSAIDGGPDGLTVTWRCLLAVEHHLLPGGSALLQLRSDDQVNRVRDQLDQAGDLILTERRIYGRGALARIQRR